MKQLVIKNLGPIHEADIKLKKVNVIIGPQSSGKSCVLKTACYCTWVEKRIELEQSYKRFADGDDFIREFVRFHKTEGYIRKDTYIGYESDFMKFSYDAAKDGSKFRFGWRRKGKRWNYRCPKVTYIPAERNIVAVIPNWYDVLTNNDNIRDFLRDWDIARKATVAETEVLNLGVKYRLDPTSNKDMIVEGDGTELNLTNASSGLQSLIPLFVHLNYLDKLQYTQNKNKSMNKVYENALLLRTIVQNLFLKKGKMAPPPGKGNPQGSKGVIEKVGQFHFSFADKKYADECREIYERYTNNQCCEIFLEEPEENLFPPTQSLLVDWLLGIAYGEHPGNIFIATHSAYVLSSLLERQDIDLGLFFTPFHEAGERTVVKTASEKDIQDICGCGVDAFYNIEYFR